MAQWIEVASVDRLCEKLDAAKLAHSSIYQIDEIMADPHYAARGSIATVEHPRVGPVKMAGVFPKFSDCASPPVTTAPDLGQHNAEIHGGLLGLPQDTLDSLARDGVI